MGFAPSTPSLLRRRRANARDADEAIHLSYPLREKDGLTRPPLGLAMAAPVSHSHAVIPIGRDNPFKFRPNT